MNKRVELFEIERRLKAGDVGGAVALVETTFVTRAKDGTAAGWEEVRARSVSLMQTGATSGIVNAYAVSAAMSYALREVDKNADTTVLLIQALTEYAKSTRERVCADLAMKELGILVEADVGSIRYEMCRADVLTTIGDINKDLNAVDQGSVAARSAMDLIINSDTVIPPKLMLWLAKLVVSRAFRIKTANGFADAVRIGAFVIDHVKYDIVEVKWLNSNIAVCRTMLAITSTNEKSALLLKAVGNREEALRIAKVLGDSTDIERMIEGLEDAKKRIKNQRW